MVENIGKSFGASFLLCFYIVSTSFLPGFFQIPRQVSVECAPGYAGKPQATVCGDTQTSAAKFIRRIRAPGGMSVI